MADDAASVRESRGHEVMAAIDSDGCGARLVIADITNDESWLSVPTSAAAQLADWR